MFGLLTTEHCEALSTAALKINLGVVSEVFITLQLKRHLEYVMRPASEVVLDCIWVKNTVWLGLKVAGAGDIVPLTLELRTAYELALLFLTVTFANKLCDVTA